MFISYKRISIATANNLYYRLTVKGYNVFFDLEEMRNNNFDQQIDQYIRSAKDIYVILEEGSLDACKPCSLQDGGKNSENDWFCKEIAFTLKEGKNIIPLLLNGYTMPPTGFFPEELKAFPLKNAPVFDYADFDTYIDKLISKKILASQPRNDHSNTSAFKFYSSQDCAIYILLVQAQTIIPKTKFHIHKYRSFLPI